MVTLSVQTTGLTIAPFHWSHQFGAGRLTSATPRDKGRYSLCDPESLPFTRLFELRIRALFNLGFSQAVTLLLDGRPDEAERLLREAADKKIGYGETMRLYAWLELRANRPDQAMEAFRRTVPGCFDEIPDAWCGWLRVVIDRAMQAQGDDSAARRIVLDEWDNFRSQVAALNLTIGSQGLLDVMYLAMLNEHDAALDALEAAMDC